MDFSKILENKPLLYTITGVIVLVLAFSIVIGILSHGGSSSKNEAEAPLTTDVDLLTTDNLGKAIEIQALLARSGIEASRKLDGTKSVIYLKKGDCDTNEKKCTVTQRDEALLAIVKSGLMDQNIGLEIFDKGDFTSTKEDKRIRLARAVNGELARLIRKIGGIDDASVFISIPEQTMFTSMQKPVTATVQITIPSGDKLDSFKVKAITNLLLGSVTGLTSDNISITDTNGNVYTGIDDAGNDIVEKSEENDKYMQQKINAQLDKLIGKGNYVATVSTFLRQSPVETSSIDYNPNRKTSVSEQTFDEGLGDKSLDSNQGVGGAVSIYVPSGMQSLNSSGNSFQNRSYERSAKETQYGVSKTQTSEYTKAGAIEEVSVAVTINKNALPPETTLDEIKDLVAGSAGPKVSPKNVTIAFADSLDPYLASDKPANLPSPAETGNPWWLAVAAIIIGLFGGLKYISSKVKAAQAKQEEELDQLKEQNYEQERQLRDVNLKAAELIEKQRQMAQGLIEQQQRVTIPSSNTNTDLNKALHELKSDLEDADEDEAGEKIKNWIERS